MLVSAKEMTAAARAGHYAIGAFNLNNLEWTKAVLKAAQECKAPVIVQCSEGAGKYMAGYKTVVDMVNDVIASQGITVPVALHLDHGSYEGCLKCIDAGFSSIMFDGSHFSIEENIAKTKELVKLAHEHGMSIEAEVGGIGGEEDGVVSQHEHGMSIEAEVGGIGGEEDGVVSQGECADPDECKLIADLGVDFLACGIGNIHGKYPENWAGLRFDVLEAIKEKVGDMPLVLHGGSGIPTEMIQKAIKLGVSKVNVNTECQIAFAEATRKYIEAGKDLQGKGFDPRKLLAPGAQAITDCVKEKIVIFGSDNKA